jgi:hypothetical protein
LGQRFLGVRLSVCLAACAAGAVVGTFVAGDGGRVEAAGAPRAELSPAQIVAMRFDSNPAFATSQQPAEAAGYGLASADSVPAPRPVIHHAARHPAAHQDPQAASREALSAYQNYASLADDLSPTNKPSVSALAYAEPAAPAARAAPAPVAQHAPAPARAAANPAATSASNAVLNAAQIASLHERLKLSSYQQQMWPPVEAALRDITYRPDRSDKSHKSSYHADKSSLIDTSSAEVQRLKSAAIPLIMSMSEDQKQEVRTMARLMGLDQLASQF